MMRRHAGSLINLQQSMRLCGRGAGSPDHPLPDMY